MRQILGRLLYSKGVRFEKIKDPPLNNLNILNFTHYKTYRKNLQRKYLTKHLNQ